jgi:hypothetical protein
MAECGKQFTQEGTGATSDAAIGDMLNKAEGACPSKCSHVKKVTQTHVFREGGAYRANADFICESLTSRTGLGLTEHFAIQRGLLLEQYAIEHGRLLEQLTIEEGRFLQAGIAAQDLASPESGGAQAGQPAGNEEAD